MSAIRVFFLYYTIGNFTGTQRLIRFSVEVRYWECPLRESLLYYRIISAYYPDWHCSWWWVTIIVVQPFPLTHAKQACKWVTFGQPLLSFLHSLLGRAYFNRLGLFHVWEKKLFYKIREFCPEECWEIVYVQMLPAPLPVRLKHQFLKDKNL